VEMGLTGKLAKFLLDIECENTFQKTNKLNERLSLDCSGEGVSF